MTLGTVERVFHVEIDDIIGVIGVERAHEWNIWKGVPFPQNQHATATMALLCTTTVTASISRIMAIGSIVSKGFVLSR